MLKIISALIDDTMLLLIVDELLSRKVISLDDADKYIEKVQQHSIENIINDIEAES